MENWNKTGKIKAIVLVLIGLPNLLFPIGIQSEESEMIIIPLIFGSIAIPIISKFNNVFLGKEIIKPNWNDNPITLKYPLVFFQFGAFFFLTIGLSMLIGTGIKYQILNFQAVTIISFGIGILVGIWLSIKGLK